MTNNLMKIKKLLFLLLVVACTTQEKVEPQPQPAEKEYTKKVIYFSENSYELSSSDRNAILETARRIYQKKDHYERIEIVGHSDQVGSEDNNLDISKKRALTVLQIFKIAGVDKELLRTSWRGETEPGVGYTSNRRVEIRYFKEN